MRDPGLEIAIKAAGGVASLARGIGIAQPSVSAWSRIPAKRVLAVEALTQVDRYVLRPDLYGSFQTPEPDAIDLLRAAGHGPLSPRIPYAEPRERFARLGLSDLALAEVEPAPRNAASQNEISLVVGEKLKHAVVAELVRQAEMDPLSLSVSKATDLVVTGRIDLQNLVKAISNVLFEK